MIASSRISRVIQFNKNKIIPYSRLFSSSSSILPEEIRKYDIFNPTEEHAALRKMVREFVEKEVDPQALKFNREEKFNVDLFRKFGQLGLLGITVEPEYGGSGMDALAAVIANEEIAASDPSLGTSYLVHSIVFVNNLNVNGNEDQRSRFLPRACAGEIIGGICMSEPSAGTDVMAMKSFARPSADGSYWTLNGTKLWITNGTIDGTDTGDAYIVYAKTNLAAKDGGLTAFIVEKGMEGFTLGRKITDKLGTRASPTAELFFTDVKIPKENILGGVGRGAMGMMRNLEIERICGAANGLGIARRCIEIMSKYSQERKAFGKPIGDFGQIQKAIAESYAEFSAGRAYTYNVARRLDLRSVGNGLDADGVKLYSAPMAKKVADRAIQVLGGNGYVGEYQVERLWRDSKLMEIGGGTPEAHHKNIYRDLKKLQGRLN